ncbi:hypothetical protein HK096_011290 [Nowakowskiella sp. JEL0078]|nr:hypothetical protein HK096_011290 [Nowakowskiella sp. JEL0078]
MHFVCSFPVYRRVVTKDVSTGVYLPQQQNVCIVSTNVGEDTFYTDYLVAGKQPQLNTSYRIPLTTTKILANASSSEIFYSFPATYPPTEMRTHSPYIIFATYVVNKVNMTLPWVDDAPVDFADNPNNCILQTVDTKAGTIAGSVIGGVVGLGIIIVLILYVRTQKQLKREMKGKFLPVQQPEKTYMWQDEYVDSEPETKSTFMTVFTAMFTFTKKQQVAYTASKPVTSSSPTSESSTSEDPVSSEKSNVSESSSNSSNTLFSIPSLRPKPKPKSASVPRPRKQNNWNFYEANEATTHTSKTYNVESSTGQTKRITMLSGPPPRGTGGSSTWKPPASAGRRFKVMVSFKPTDPDEMAVDRNDIVMIEEMFEDGWARAWREGNMYYTEITAEEAEKAEKKKQKVALKDQIHQNSTTSTSKREVVLTKERMQRSGLVPFHYLAPARDEDVALSAPKKNTLMGLANSLQAV